MFFIRHVPDGNWKVLAKNSTLAIIPYHIAMFLPKVLTFRVLVKVSLFCFYAKRFWYVLGLTYAEMRK